MVGREPLITFVTFGELTKWAEIRDWGERRRGDLADWLAGMAVIPGDEAIAATWGATLCGLEVAICQVTPRESGLRAVTFDIPLG